MYGKQDGKRSAEKKSNTNTRVMVDRKSKITKGMQPEREKETAKERVKVAKKKDESEPGKYEQGERGG